MAFILIILSAALYTAAFYNSSLYILSWISLIPFLYYSLKLKRASAADFKKIFLQGWSLGFFILLFSANFLYFSIELYTGASFIIIILLLIILFSILALIYGFFFLIYRIIEKKLLQQSQFNPYFFAFVWTLMELARHYLFYFFPIANPAYTQAEFLYLLQLAEYGGIWLITFILILFNGFFYQFIVEKKRKNLLPAAALIIIMIFFANYSLQAELAAERERENKNIGIITTVIDQELKWSGEQFKNNIEIFIDSAAVLNETQLIIAPETNLTFDFYSDSYYQQQLLNQINDQFQAPVQIGSLAGKTGVEGRFNSVFLISSSGEIINRYDKNLLLYFGETYPLEALLNKYTPYNFSSLNSGEGNNVFVNGDLKWQNLICSEILYPNYSDFDSEIDFILNPTNEAWFRDNKLLKNIMWQAAIFRAVENRTPFIKTGNQSYNGIIFASGNYQKVNSAEKYHSLNFQ